MTWRWITLCLAGSTLLLAETPAQQAAGRINGHSLEMFQAFRRMTKGNFSFSPYSGHRLASLLAEGATGETQRQLLDFTGMDPDKAGRMASLEAVSEALRTGKPGMSLDVCNAIWVPSTASLAPGFEDLAARLFSTSFKKLPGGDAVACSARINAWVREKTLGKISDLIGPRNFAAGTSSAVLVNTLHLRVAWAQDFDPRMTRRQAFLPASGTTLILPMMKQQRRFDYAEGPAWQCLDMPFIGGDYAMAFLLARPESDRDSVEAALDANAWTRIISGMGSREAVISLPRFSFSTQVTLNGLWQSMGVHDVFDSGSANLGGMIRGSPCFIGDIVHQTSVEVNELGARVAAATTAAAPFGDAPGPSDQATPVLFTANRPFLWFVRHRPTGLLLFMGRFAGE
jgi:serpin B